ncbi:hypothetical protein OsI_18974 [Oryza sativa Indica Group]|uniref:Uncharacterized protein n=1 Tax=Oryza sativa subsp. indica TaxID=39946 RepID=A2Y1U2_ORYSI|nr:hypothetical protein OsI_18974 [Oryza sativa Indica Group]
MDPHAGAVASGESAGDEDDGSGEHETHPTSSAPSANSRPRKRSRLTAAADESTTVDDCSAGGSGSGSGDGGESVGAWPYDESAARDELVTLIVSQDLPVGIDYHTWVTTTSARPPLWQNNLIFETTFIF